MSIGQQPDLNDILEHYGVKGMRWGVRRSQAELDRAAGRKPKLGSKRDVRKMMSTKNHFKVVNKAADEVNKNVIPKLNNNPKYKGKDLTKNSKLLNQYDREFERGINKALDKASLDVHGVKNYKGRQVRVEVKYDVKKGLYYTRLKEVEHSSDFPTETYGVKLSRNSTGHIIGIEFLTELKQSIIGQESAERVLEHYGILGMRWGVRRSQAELDRAAGRRVAKGKPVTKTKRVERIKRKKEVSSDAERAQEAKKKAKRSGAQALSNQELKELNNRMNLEQNYNRLITEQKGKSLISRGYDQVKSIIGVGKTASEAYNLAKSPMAQDIAKVLAKNK